MPCMKKQNKFIDLHRAMSRSLLRTNGNIKVLLPMVYGRHLRQIKSVRQTLDGRQGWAVLWAALGD